jgi:exosome complex component RRP46
MRPVQISFGDLERADGSCTLSQGQTKVLCAVYGPVEPRNIKQERMDRAFVEVICRPSQGISGPNDRAIEVFIRDIFEQVIMIALHPRTRISIVLQVVHNDGSVSACT